MIMINSRLFENNLNSCLIICIKLKKDVRKKESLKFKFVSTVYPSEGSRSLDFEI